MNKMSRTFYQALSLSGSYDYDLAIKLYDEEIKVNDPKNFAAWNNRGVEKVKKGIVENNATLVNEGIDDFKQAILLANETSTHGYPGAEANVEWAAKELLNIKH
jgi:tetratricopeptide (TPR) repeat protein